MSFEAVCLKAMPSPSFQPEENVFPGMEPLWIADESQQRVPIIKTPAWVQQMVSLLSFPWADRSASGSDACDFPKCSQPEGSGVILPVCVCAAGLGYHMAVHGSRHRNRHRHRGVRLVSHRGLLPCLEVFRGAGPELCCQNCSCQGSGAAAEQGITLSL